MGEVHLEEAEIRVETCNLLHDGDVPEVGLYGYAIIGIQLGEAVFTDRAFMQVALGGLGRVVRIEFLLQE
jgi:hypothetical protein